MRTSMACSNSPESGFGVRQAGWRIPRHVADLDSTGRWFAGDERSEHIDVPVSASGYSLGTRPAVLKHHRMHQFCY